MLSFCRKTEDIQRWFWSKVYHNFSVFNVMYEVWIFKVFSSAELIICHYFVFSLLRVLWVTHVLFWDRFHSACAKWLASSSMQYPLCQNLLANQHLHNLLHPSSPHIKICLEVILQQPAPNSLTQFITSSHKVVIISDHHCFYLCYIIFDCHYFSQCHIKQVCICFFIQQNFQCSVNSQKDTSQVKCFQ